MRMTNRRMVEMEARNRGTISFTINFARMQFGNRVGRAVAKLIEDGHDVHTVPFTDRMGFFVDGSFMGLDQITDKGVSA